MDPGNGVRAPESGSYKKEGEENEDGEGKTGPFRMKTHLMRKKKQKMLVILPKVEGRACCGPGFRGSFFSRD